MSISNAALIGLGILAVVWLWYKMGRGVFVLLVLAVPLVGVWMLVHSFQAFNATTLVATVQAVPVANMQHEMAVSLTTYDSAGNPTHKEYELAGDRWELNADVVSYQDWVHFFGISNGFQLSRLTSQYGDMDAHSITPIVIGSGSPTIAIPFIEKSHYRGGVLEPDDGVEYRVYVTLQGSMYAVHA